MTAFKSDFVDSLLSNHSPLVGREIAPAKIISSALLHMGEAGQRLAGNLALTFLLSNYIETLQLLLSN